MDAQEFYSLVANNVKIELIKQHLADGEYWDIGEVEEQVGMAIRDYAVKLGKEIALDFRKE